MSVMHEVASGIKAPEDEGTSIVTAGDDTWLPDVAGNGGNGGTSEKADTT